MARPPRKPREISRAAAPADPVVAGGDLSRADPRQVDLFAPAFIEPCKPKLATTVPVGPLWQFEIKQDGYRAQCHIRADEIRIFTKNGHGWTERFPGIVAALQALPVHSAVLDGGAIIEGASFISDFWALHQAAAKRWAPDALLYAFDLLELDGEDLRPLPLVERQFRLTEILTPGVDGIDLAPHLVDDQGEAMLKHVCGLGMEGVVAKRRDAPYRSGYQDAWLKLKCTETASFAVIGSEPAGRSSVRALRLAHLVGGELTPCGWVGAGIAEASGKATRAALDRGQPVVVDVEYRGWTPTGELRHAVLKGWHVGD